MTIPVMNVPHLIKKLVASIDFPVTKVMFVHNQGYMQPNSQVSHIINNAANANVKEFVVKEYIVNIGVSGSWNYGLMNMECPYNLIVNSDVSFSSNTLSKIHDIMSRQNNICTLLQFGIQMSAFAITRSTFCTIGPFDENMWPAYSEDCDYYKRLAQQSCPIKKYGNATWFYHYGSASWRTSSTRSDYRRQIQNSNNYFNNFDYMDQKWGCNTNGSCAQCDSHYTRQAPRKWVMNFDRRAKRGGPPICIGCSFDWNRTCTSEENLAPPNRKWPVDAKSKTNSRQKRHRTRMNP